MSLIIDGDHVTPSGLPYQTGRRPSMGPDEVVVAVGNWKASKGVRRDASPRDPSFGLRWRSMAGETFDNLDEVAESMRWAVTPDNKPEPTLYRCMMEWHFGTIGPIFHVDPDGRSGWKGYHGALTPNASHVCDECAADWRANYPGHEVPSYTSAEVAALLPAEVPAGTEQRLEELRAALRAENISWSELAELQGMASQIDPGDVELLEAAGVPEFPAEGKD